MESVPGAACCWRRRCHLRVDSPTPCSDAGARPPRSPTTTSPRVQPQLQGDRATRCPACAGQVGLHALRRSSAASTARAGMVLLCDWCAKQGYEALAGCSVRVPS